MEHSSALITTIAAAFALALVLGYLAVRVNLPALVGYLVAGIVLGPATPGYVADLGLAQQLSDIGVMLLMFGVGLHFSWHDLASVRRIAVPGALGRIVVGTALGAGLARMWGWSLGAGIVFGVALSVASTVVLLRALEGRGLVASINGRIAVGWLVVEDLVTVLVLVLLPPLAGLLGGTPPVEATGAGGAGEGLAWPFLVTLGKMSAFVVLMFVLGRRLFPWVLWRVARTGSRELFTLCVIAAAVGTAYGSAAVFGVSFALGAFFAGMLLSESELSHRAANESLPLRDAFAVLFFVSVGMLFDPRVLLDRPLQVLGVLTIVVVGKTLAAFFIVLAFRYPLNTALTVSAGLAQIGEFSFILAGVGTALGVLPAEAQGLIIAGALISIAVNPLVFGLVEPARKWILSRSGLARRMEGRDDPLAELPPTVQEHRLTGHVLVVGYGRVGRRIGEALTERGIPIVVAEQNRDVVAQLRERGIPAVSGDAAEAAVLIQAHVARARILVIAVPDAFRARQMIEIGLALNPTLETVVRVHDDDEAAALRKDRAGSVFMGEHELAVAMTRHVLERVGAVAAGRGDGDDRPHAGW